MPLIETEVPARTCGNGKLSAVAACAARFAPNTDTSDPGAMGPDKKFAPFTAPLGEIIRHRAGLSLK